MKKIIVLIIAAAMIFASCTAAPKENTDTKVQKTNETMTREETGDKEAEPTAEPTAAPTAIPEPLPDVVAVVVSRDRYAPQEFNPVMEALTNAGYDAVVVSDALGSANGTTETVEVEKIFTDFNGVTLRGIVLIGGSDSLWENAELHALLGDCKDNSRLTAAICLASVTLAKAGIIGEGDSACWFNCDIADPEMEAVGVIDSGEPVTADGLIITGDGPSSAEEFAGVVVDALNNMDKT